MTKERPNATGAQDEDAVVVAHAHAGEVAPGLAPVDDEGGIGRVELGGDDLVHLVEDEAVALDAVGPPWRAGRGTMPRLGEATPADVHPGLGVRGGAGTGDEVADLEALDLGAQLPDAADGLVAEDSRVVHAEGEIAIDDMAIGGGAGGAIEDVAERVVGTDGGLGDLADD